MKTKLTTHQLAGLIFMRPDEINHHLMDMVPAGLIPADTLKRKQPSGAVDLSAANPLGITDLIKLAIHVPLDTQQTNAMLQAWQELHAAEVKGHIARARRAVPKRETSADRDVIRRFFDGKARFLKLLHVPGDADASDLGLRRVGDMLMIGTSTPVVRQAMRASGIQPRELFTALKALPGTSRIGAKRFAGHASKAYLVRVDELLRVIE
ncbi:hypothetical protein K32_48550 [Kaistia sp. 32K]|nr:hypothetical protein K32_48550 [Kaistia sp. 32K]